MIGDFLWFGIVTLLTFVAYIVAFVIGVVMIALAPFWGFIILMAALLYDVKHGR